VANDIVWPLFGPVLVSAYPMRPTFSGTLIKYIHFKKWTEDGGPKPAWAENNWADFKSGPKSDLPNNII